MWLSWGLSAIVVPSCAGQCLGLGHGGCNLFWSHLATISVDPKVLCQLRLHSVTVPVVFDRVVRSPGQLFGNLCPAVPPYPSVICAHTLSASVHCVARSARRRVSAHRCARISVSSSFSDHGPFRTSGLRWFCQLHHTNTSTGVHSQQQQNSSAPWSSLEYTQTRRNVRLAHRSRHCFPTLPGSSSAMTDHCRAPCSATIRRTTSSSCAVGGVSGRAAAMLAALPAYLLLPRSLDDLRAGGLRHTRRQDLCQATAGAHVPARRAGDVLRRSGDGGVTAMPGAPRCRSASAACRRRNVATRRASATASWSR